MYFRCTDCYAATWVQGVDTTGAARTLQCRSCGRGFTVRPAANLGSSARDQYEIALALAEGNGIDLPTSYSIILGIMTLEHAMVLRDRGVPLQETGAESGAAPDDQDAPATEPSVVPATSAGGTPVVEHDPAFAEAVAQGYLSIQQAIERGDRNRFARRLADRHGLDTSLAFLVADNKISLTAAIRKDREEVAEVLRPVKVAVWKRAFAAVVASLALVAVGMYSIHVWSELEQEHRKVEEWGETVTTKVEKVQEENRPAPRKPGELPGRRVRIRKDDDGQVTEIVGPDPSSVLLAYCANLRPADRYTAVELTSTVPPLLGTKLGILKDALDFENTYAIQIRRSMETGRWEAGDGLRPLVAQPAPELPANASRNPVVTRQARHGSD